ncbi:MAG: hypothetical protein WCK90_04860 [archaeon]
MAYDSDVWNGMAAALCMVVFAGLAAVIYEGSKADNKYREEQKVKIEQRVEKQNKLEEFVKVQNLDFNKLDLQIKY